MDVGPCGRSGDWRRTMVKAILIWDWSPSPILLEAYSRGRLAVLQIAVMNFLSMAVRLPVVGRLFVRWLFGLSEEQYRRSGRHCRAGWVSHVDGRQSERKNQLSIDKRIDKGYCRQENQNPRIGKRSFDLFDNLSGGAESHCLLEQPPSQGR